MVVVTINSQNNCVLKAKNFNCIALQFNEIQLFRLYIQVIVIQYYHIYITKSQLIIIKMNMNQINNNMGIQFYIFISIYIQLFDNLN